MALPKESWVGEEVSWLPAVREQTLHVALGVGTTGEINLVIQFFLFSK